MNTQYNPSGNPLVDLNFSVERLKTSGYVATITSFDQAFREYPELTMRWLFYLRDIQYGRGERKLFNVFIEYLVDACPEAIRPLVKFIPVYGRWDDLLILINTSCHKEVMELIKKQLNDDIYNLAAGCPISMIGKWLPSINTSSKSSRYYAGEICKYLRWTAAKYRRVLSMLREELNVVERKMSAKQWDKIDYTTVPMNALYRYTNAFMKHDQSRFVESIVHREEERAKNESAQNRSIAKVVSEMMDEIGWDRENIVMMEPDKVNEVNRKYDRFLFDTQPTSMIPVIDTSISMLKQLPDMDGVTCLDMALALTFYLTSRNVGPYQNRYITYESYPSMMDLDGCRNLKDMTLLATARRTTSNCVSIDYVYDRILERAVDKEVNPLKIPSYVLVMTDIPFDRGAQTHNGKHVDHAIMAEIKKEYAGYGYTMPKLVYWNMRSDQYHPLRFNDDIDIIDGCNQTLPNRLVALAEYINDYERLLSILNSPRYNQIQIEKG